MGLVVDWLSCRWVYEQHLKIANDHRKRLVEALRQKRPLNRRTTTRLGSTDSALAGLNQPMKLTSGKRSRAGRARQRALRAHNPATAKSLSSVPLKFPLGKALLQTVAGLRL